MALHPITYQLTFHPGETFSFTHKLFTPYEDDKADKWRSFEEGKSIKTRVKRIANQINAARLSPSGYSISLARHLGNFSSEKEIPFSPRYFAVILDILHAFRTDWFFADHKMTKVEKWESYKCPEDLQKISLMIPAFEWNNEKHIADLSYDSKLKGFFLKVTGNKAIQGFFFKKEDLKIADIPIEEKVATVSKEVNLHHLTKENLKYKA